MLLDLPNDILLDVLQYLLVMDLLSVKRVRSSANIVFAPSLR